MNNEIDYRTLSIRNAEGALRNAVALFGYYTAQAVDAGCRDTPDTTRAAARIERARAELEAARNLPAS